MKKILYIIFLLLCIITLVEIGYYFYYTNPIVEKNNQKAQAIKGKTLPAPTEFITPTISIRWGGVLNNQAIDALRIITKDVIQSSIVTNTYRGKINLISTKSGTLRGINNFVFNYTFIMRIMGKDNGFNDFAFDENLLKKTKVYRLVNGKEIPISIYDLRVGDTITSIETLDLTKDLYSYVQSVKITKE